MSEPVVDSPTMMATRATRPSVRKAALAGGIAFAAWVHTEAFGTVLSEFYRDVRWPYIAAGGFAMLLATIRPMRWMIIAVATAAPTALTGCYFVGTALATGSGLPWHHARIAVTMLLATVVGAMVGRVAGGIRSGQ